MFQPGYISTFNPGFSPLLVKLFAAVLLVFLWLIAQWASLGELAAFALAACFISSLIRSGRNILRGFVLNLVIFVVGFFIIGAVLYVLPLSSPPGESLLEGIVGGSCLVAWFDFSRMVDIAARTVQRQHDQRRFARKISEALSGDGLQVLHHALSRSAHATPPVRLRRFTPA